MEAFEAERAILAATGVEEVDPELVLVFDLAGSVKDFKNAISRIDGLEFLSELLDEESEPDDDFSMETRAGVSDSKVQHSLYLVMSNATAVAQLLSLFSRWQQDPTMTFELGLGKFRAAFEQLSSIRRWSATDRVRETGLLETWAERLEVVGQALSTVLIEIELWYRKEPSKRRAAEAHVRSLVEAAGGTAINRAEIADIAYHALLVDVPVQQVETVLRDGATAIDLMNADEIMFLSPYTPMSLEPVGVDPELQASTEAGPVEGLPRIALLDGLPFENHDTLVGRLIVDDPDDLAATYPVTARNHGTAMASLIVHGDLSAPGPPLGRPLYVRPILQPHPHFIGSEVVVNGELLTDLLHRSVRRIVLGDDGAPAAPSVRIINLSIGAESRALVRRMSPLGRLLDWLAVEYNLLFIVSAGNHSNSAISIPAEAAGDAHTARLEAMRSVSASARVRGVLPPGDAVNALTVGAVHADAAGDVPLPDTAWDVSIAGAPALYSAFGPGVGRSIKPDVYHQGGRAIFQKPIPAGTERIDLQRAKSAVTGPGVLVAAPKADGSTDAAIYTYGTSNAAALASREASAAFDALESGRADADDFAFPDAQFHPVLAKALLVHTSAWGDAQTELTEALGLESAAARRHLTALLGYGIIRSERVARAAVNRAVLIAAASIGRDQRHTYRIPLPKSLLAIAEWHRFTVTLAYMAPTASQLNRYREAKVFFEKLDDARVGGKRIDADHHAVRRGSVQHEIFDGRQALVFNEGDSLELHIECMDDAHRLRAGNTIRYGVVVSVETAVETSSTIHDEVRAALRAQLVLQSRARVQP